MESLKLQAGREKEVEGQGGGEMWGGQEGMGEQVGRWAHFPNPKILSMVAVYVSVSMTWNIRADRAMGKRPGTTGKDLQYSVWCFQRKELGVLSVTSC